MIWAPDAQTLKMLGLKFLHSISSRYTLILGTLEV